MSIAGRLPLFAAAVAVALTASAVGAAAATVKVTIKDLALFPPAITVHVGDTIEWTNLDFVAHTATAVNGDFDVEIEPGTSAHTVVSKAGVVAYFCQFHPDMKATVTVLPN